MVDSEIYDEEWQADSDAPYGRKPDGTPYRISPEERARRGAQMAAGRAAKTGKPKPAAGMSPPPLAAANGPAGAVNKATADRRAAITSWLNLPIGILAGIGRVWQPAMLDAMTLTVHSGTIAQAGAVAADANPALAKWVDKLTASSPYVPLAIAAAGLVAQVAVNHGFMEPNAQLGSMPVDDMKDRFYATLGVPRPASDPRADSIPDYPPSDLADAPAAA